jgi:hypothetical protein
MRITEGFGEGSGRDDRRGGSRDYAAPSGAPAGRWAGRRGARQPVRPGAVAPGARPSGPCDVVLRVGSPAATSVSRTQSRSAPLRRPVEELLGELEHVALFALGVGWSAGLPETAPAAAIGTDRRRTFFRTLSRDGPANLCSARACAHAEHMPAESRRLSARRATAANQVWFPNATCLKVTRCQDIGGPGRWRSSGCARQTTCGALHGTEAAPDTLDGQRCEPARPSDGADQTRGRS